MSQSNIRENSQVQNDLQRSQVPNDNVEESQASISFRSKRRISGHNVPPPLSQSRLENLNRTAALIFGNGAALSPQPPSLQQSVGNEKESQSSIVFRSKRHLPGNGLIFCFSEHCSSNVIFYLLLFDN
jgi:hypothetical protein